MQDTDAATIVHALIPARWGDPDAWTITGFEVERILDNLDAIAIDDERRDAYRSLLTELGWLAASGVYGTATALHRLSASASREQIAYALVDAAVEVQRLTTGDA